MAINYTSGSPFSNELANRLVTSGSSLLDSAANKVTDLASSTYNTITSTDFLVSAGVGLIGAALGSKVTRPSLNFPKLAATTQVALSVGQALKAGAATVNEIANAKKGMLTTKSLQPVNIQLTNPASDIDAEIRSRSTNEIKFITYPGDLATAYSIGFTFYEYENSKFYEEIKVEPRDVIRLPLPSNLTDALAINYNNFDMGPLRGPTIKETVGRFKDVQSSYDLGEKIKTAGQDLVAFLTNNTDEVGQLVGRRLLQQLSPDTASALDLALGSVPNPHTTVSFNGVGLRAFRFTWRLSPNNAKDSQELTRLIFALKSKSLPRQQTQFLLKYPDFVKVRIYPQVLNDFFQFTTMIIDSFAVNYAPTGNIAFMADDMPHEVELTLTLRETRIQTAEDYDEMVWLNHVGLMR